MPWLRIEDTFFANRKVRQAWSESRASVGLHVLCMSYAAGQLTNGAIDRAFVYQHLTNREQKRVVSTLENAGLWIPNSDGWQVKDWLDYNPSAEETRARRAADAQRQADYRARRNAVTPNGLTRESPRPDPPDPPIERENKQRERKRMGGPTHDEANQAGLSWAKRKRELEGTDEQEPS